MKTKDIDGRIKYLEDELERQKEKISYLSKFLAQHKHTLVKGKAYKKATKDIEDWEIECGDF